MKKILLDHDSIEDLFGKYKKESGFFDLLDGTFFGGFNYEAPDERAEMASLLFAIESARISFNLVSLGAAPGEWAIKGERAFRHAKPGAPFKSYCLEGDIEHFQLIKRVMELNGATIANHHVSYRVITDRDGFAYFPIINSALDWGAGVAAVSERVDNLDQNISISDVALRDRLGATGGDELQYRTVDAVSLATLFQETGYVDYLHSDIQGAEANVFTAHMDAMDANVRIACISTHGREIERRLIHAFDEHGWKEECLFPCHSRDEEIGEIVSKDGIFTWSNPRFGAYP